MFPIRDLSQKNISMRILTTKLKNLIYFNTFMKKYKIFFLETMHFNHIYEILLFWVLKTLDHSQLMSILLFRLPKTLRTQSLLGQTISN